MKDNGTLLEKYNPQPEVRKNAENAKDWPYHDEAAYLYGKALLFKDRLLDPLHHLDRTRLPDPVIAFENLRNHNTLAAFRLTRSPQGLQNEIIMNTSHYVEQDGKMVWEYGRWAQLETLLHEQVHEWQQVFGKDPVSLKRIYHNKEFIEKCESLGLHPMPVVGCHVAVADGVFALLMKELGIERPENVPSSGKFDWFEGKKEKKGTSTLNNWVCPECGMHARIGIKGNPELIHHSCSEKKGEPVFLVPVAMLGINKPT
jgi:hypothetical protein